MLSRGSGKRLNAFDQSGNKPPSGVGEIYWFWLETVEFTSLCKLLCCYKITLPPSQHRRTCSNIATLWETVCLFLALAISDWLLPRTPLHLRACRLPAVRMEIHYNVKTSWFLVRIVRFSQYIERYRKLVTIIQFDEKTASVMQWFASQTTIQEVPGSIPGYMLEIFSGNIGSGTGSTQLREDDWVATWLRNSEIRWRKLKLGLRDNAIDNHKAPSTVTWQQPL